MYRRRIKYRSPPRPVSGPFGPAEVAPSETEIRTEFQLQERVARPEAVVDSAILNIFNPDVCIAGSACVQLEYLLQADNAKYVAGKENSLIQSCVRQLSLLQNVKARMTSTDSHYKVYRSLFRLVLSFYDVEALAKNISKYVLQALINQLFTLLVDGHFEDWENGYEFTHCIYIIIARIVEKSDHTNVTSALIELLRNCSLNTSTSTRFTELVMKSLGKVVKLFPTWEDTDLSVILYDIHLFMKDLPSPSWKKRYTEEPFRTIKTFLHTMQGQIDNTNESELHSYLVKLLKKAAEVPDKNSEEMPAGINSPDTSTDDSMCTVIHRSLRNVHNSIQDSEFSDDQGSDTGTENENSESPCATSEKAAEVPDKNSEEMPAGINSPDTSTDGSEFSVLNDSSKCDKLSFKFNTLIIQGTPENSSDQGSDTGTENENSESPCATSEGSGQSGEGTAPGASFSGDRYVADDHQVVEESDDHLRGLNLNTLEQLRNSIETRPHENVFSDEPKGLKESVELMPHQKQALAWLMWREKQIPSGGILADDKGLGTTLTMISLILKTKEEDESDESGESKVGGTLVICPTKLRNHWLCAAMCRTEVLKVKLHHGARRDATCISLSRYDMIITSYNIVRIECSKRGALFQMNWKRIILDDALIIRNHKNQTSSAVAVLKAKYRWAVTGAPIHNNNDLYAIIKFLKYSPFDVYSDWRRLVDDKTAAGIQQLETILDTLMLKRTEEQLQTL